MWWWILASEASCIASPKQTHISSMTLAPKQPIMAWATVGSGEELAERLRLRDSKGELVAVHREHLGLAARLRPKRPLKPGVYIVEERGDYDADGGRLWYSRQSAAHSAWFEHRTIEVVKSGVAHGEPPGVRWRYGGGRTGIVVGEVEVDDRTVWAELEVKGVGPIDRGHIRWPSGQIRVSTAANERCNDVGKTMPLGPGDLEVRVVLHGAEGFTAKTAWTTIAPGGTGPMHNPPVAGPPGGTPAVTDALTTWTPVESEPVGPLVVQANSCGSLEAEGEETVTGRMLRDQVGRLHRVDPAGGTVDGLQLPIAGHGV